jgi:hypothetical protein
MMLSPWWLYFLRLKRRLAAMKTKTIPQADKLIDDDTAPERGYAAWKAARVATAQHQAKDRSAMIDADMVWRQLGCDD